MDVVMAKASRDSVGTVEHWAEKVAVTFPSGVRVIPPEDVPNFTAEAGKVWQDEDGRILFQIWPSPFKDLHIDLATVTETERGWQAEVIGDQMLLQPWAPGERTGIGA